MQAWRATCVSQELEETETKLSVLVLLDLNSAVDHNKLYY